MEKNTQELIEKVVHISRVAKVVKGGKIFSFSVLAVAGDGNGKVGSGLGKAREVPMAIAKAMDRARKNMKKVMIVEGTIPHEITGHYGAGSVVLRPASQGTGVIAGGPVRAVVEACGIQNILTKSIGTNNPHNVVKATLNGLSKLQTEEYNRQLRA